MKMIFCDIGDAKELSEMAAEIWIDYYSTFLDAELPRYVVSISQTEEAIVSQIEKGHLYSYIMDGDVKAGYFCIVPEGDSLFMSKLYLWKEFRGKGLGSKTMDEIIEKGRSLKAKRVYLRVNKDNKPSIEFYTRKGFVIAEAIEEDIGGGFTLDDYLMEYRF
jgi:GNAT superfamily N-acetyltransferase